MTNEIKIVRVVSKSKKYKDLKGKEHCSVNHYIVVGDCWIAFRPSFSKGYAQLDTICETITND